MSLDTGGRRQDRARAHRAPSNRRCSATRTRPRHTPAGGRCNRPPDHPRPAPCQAPTPSARPALQKKPTRANAAQEPEVDRRQSISAYRPPSPIRPMVLAGPGRTIKNERRNQRGRYTRPAQARQPARHQRGTRRSARGPALGEQQRHERGRHRDPGRKRVRPTTSVQPVWNALISASCSGPPTCARSPPRRRRRPGPGKVAAASSFVAIPQSWAGRDWLPRLRLQPKNGQRA